MSDFDSLFGGPIDNTGSDIGTGDYSTDFPTTNTDVSDLFGTSGNLDDGTSFYDPISSGGNLFDSPISSPTPTSFLGGLSSDLNSFFGGGNTQSGTTPANQSLTGLGGLLGGLGTLFQPTLANSGGVPTTANASTTGSAIGGLFSNPLILIGGIVVLVLLFK